MADSDPSDTQRSPGQVNAQGRSCLSENEVLDFAQGRLSDGQIEAVNAHIDRCANCQYLVNEAMHAQSGSGLESDESSWNPMFQPGEVIGRRYRIQHFVAHGGMGEVYDAYDQELQERVALKTVIASASDNQRAARRLKAEVQLARRVAHPNVCRIFDLGTHVLDGTGNVLNFLTMEFIEGESLSKRIKQGKLALAEVERLARQLLLGLAAAHGAGIIHRDFKSDNVMLRPTPSGEPSAVIMDFGLARTIDVNAARLTSGANHALVGTPRYMAPEQLEGRTLSTATDVYAFGVVWFEMLTGQLPFRGSVLYERLTKPAPAPSSVCPEVPARVDSIVLRCLNRVPEERFATADQILEALDAPAASPSVTEIAASPRRSSRLAVGPIAVGISMGALGAIGMAFMPGGTRPTAKSAASLHSELSALMSSASTAQTESRDAATRAEPPSKLEPVGTEREDTPKVDKTATVSAGSPNKQVRTPVPRMANPVQAHAPSASASRPAATLIAVSEQPPKADERAKKLEAPTPPAPANPTQAAPHPTGPQSSRHQTPAIAQGSRLRPLPQGSVDDCPVVRSER
jgi:serine/threonine protein kinase